MKRSALVLWLLAPFLLWLSLYRPFPGPGGHATSLPSRVGAFTLVRDHELSPRTQELLGTTDATWRTYRDSEGHEIYLVAVFHEQNWKSVHPPRICIEGSNMTVTAETERELVPGEPAAPHCALLEAKSNESGRLYASCYLYGTAEFTTPDYARFFMHHAPAALLRRNTSGFLLRAETWASKDSEPDLERLRTFLRTLLPLAQGLLK